MLQYWLEVVFRLVFLVRWVPLWGTEPSGEVYYLKDPGQTGQGLGSKGGLKAPSSLRPFGAPLRPKRRIRRLGEAVSSKRWAELAAMEITKLILKNQGKLTMTQVLNRVSGDERTKRHAFLALVECGRIYPSGQPKLWWVKLD